MSLVDNWGVSHSVDRDGHWCPPSASQGILGAAVLTSRLVAKPSSSFYPGLESLGLCITVPRIPHALDQKTPMDNLLVFQAASIGGCCCPFETSENPNSLGAEALRDM